MYTGLNRAAGARTEVRAPLRPHNKSCQTLTVASTASTARLHSRTAVSTPYRKAVTTLHTMHNQVLETQPRAQLLQCNKALWCSWAQQQPAIAAILRSCAERHIHPTASAARRCAIHSPAGGFARLHEQIAPHSPCHAGVQRQRHHTNNLLRYIHTAGHLLTHSAAKPTWGLSGLFVHAAMQSYPPSKRTITRAQPAGHATHPQPQDRTPPMARCPPPLPKATTPLHASCFSKAVSTEHSVNSKESSVMATATLFHARLQVPACWQKQLAASVEAASQHWAA